MLFVLFLVATATAASATGCVEVPPGATDEASIPDRDERLDSTILDSGAPADLAIDDGRGDISALDLAGQEAEDAGIGPNGRPHDAEPPLEPSDAESPSPDPSNDGRG